MYTVLDFETTGLDYQKEQVIEIGAIKLDRKFNEVGTFHVMVALQHFRTLPEFITELTGITDLDLIGGMNEVTALHLLKEFIGDDVVVAQFASFDLGFLSKVMEPELFICTRTMSQLLNPTERAGLKDLCARYDVQLQHHRSISDVKATIEVFKIMKAELDKKHIAYTNLMFSSEERPLKFIPVNGIVGSLDEVKF